MSTIAENLSRIQQAKADIKTAIEAKGVSVPSSATIDTYDDYVSQISGGGGSSADTEALKGLIERSATSIDIPSGTTTIGNYVFNYYTSLSSVTIPNSVTSIGNSAFYRCTSLSSVTIPNSVTSIGNSAFYYCTHLTSIDIPSGITSINDSTFNYCDRLSSVTISNNVTRIGSEAFGKCYTLKSIDIPSGVTSIGNSAFNGCSSLSSITVNATTPPTLGSYALNSTNDCPIYVPEASVDTYKSASGWSSYASRIQAIPNYF